MRTMAAMPFAVLLLAGCVAGSSAVGAPEELPAPPALVADYASYVEFSSKNAIGKAASYAEADDAVAACMKLEGFDYLRPERTSAVQELADRYGDPAASNYYSKDYRANFGFGISTLWAYGFEETSYTTSEISGVNDSSDPKYLQTLFGGEDVDGCIEAGEEVRRSFVAEPPAASESGDLTAYMQKLFATQDAIDAERDWAVCAANAGYDFTSMTEVEDYFYSRLDDYRVEPVSEELIATPNDTNLEAEAQLPAYPFDLETIHQLQSEEVEVALALYPCEAAFYRDIEDVASSLAIEMGVSVDGGS